MNRKQITLISFLILLLFVSQGITLSQITKFVAIGDYGQDGTGLADVADLVDDLEVDFIITLGDNNYEDGCDYTIDINVGKYFHHFIKPYLGSYGSGSPDSNRFWPSLGNHDLYNCIGLFCAQNFHFVPTYACSYRNYFTLPNHDNSSERYYKFEPKSIPRGTVEFFVVNSDFGGLGNRCSPTCWDTTTWEPHQIDSNSRQAQWFKTQLGNSTANWKIVYMHYPPWSSTAIEDLDSLIKLQWPFKSWGADMVLAGHNHLYERLNIDDFVYTVNGLGGAGINAFLYDPRPGSQVLSNGQVQYRENHGVQYFEVYDDSIIMKFINVDNEVIDNYKFPTATLKLAIQIEGLYYSTLDSLFRDSIHINLRNSSSPFGIVDISRGYQDTAGTMVIDFPDAQNSTNYYLQVTHRNSVETWSGSTISFTDYYATYDFTSSNSQSYGPNMTYENPEWCFYSGDVDQDGFVDLTDLIAINYDSQNFLYGYYLTNDLDADSLVDLTDLVMAANNSNNFVGKITP